MNFGQHKSTLQERLYHYRKIYADLFLVFVLLNNVILRKSDFQTGSVGFSVTSVSVRSQVFLYEFTSGGVAGIILMRLIRDQL